MGENFVERAGQAAQFSPDFDPAASTSSIGLAWCVYEFSVAGYGEAAQVQTSWQDSVPAERAWLGLSDWGLDAWRWYAINDNGLAATPELSSAIDGDGRLLIAVVLTGTSPALLNWLRLGGNLVPCAQLSANIVPDSDPPQMQLDATTCDDLDGVIIDFEWDLDDDGIFGEAGTEEEEIAGLDSGIASHDETVEQISVRVTDDGGAVATAAANVPQGWLHTHNVNYPDSIVDIQDEWYDIAIGPDGSIYIAGSANGADSSHLEIDAIISKWSPSGVWEWTRRWGNEEGEEIFRAVAVAADGTVYCAGHFATTGVCHVVLTSFSEEGDVGWEKAWIATRDSDAFDIAVDAGGSIYLTGTLAAGDEDPDAVLVQRYLTDGSLSWSREWTTTADAVTEFGAYVACLPNDNIVIATTKNPTGGHTSADVILLSFNPLGDLLSQQGWDSAIYDVARGVAVDAAGNIWICGRHMRVSARADALVMRWSAADTFDFARIWGNEDSERAYGLAVNPLGGVVVTGWHGNLDEEDHAFLIGINAMGGLTNGLLTTPGEGRGVACLSGGAPVGISSYRGPNQPIETRDAPLLNVDAPPYDEVGTVANASGETMAMHQRFTEPDVEIDVTSFLLDNTAVYRLLEF